MYRKIVVKSSVIFGINFHSNNVRSLLVLGRERILGTVWCGWTTRNHFGSTDVPSGLSTYIEKDVWDDFMVGLEQKKRATPNVKKIAQLKSSGIHLLKALPLQIKNCDLEGDNLEKNVWKINQSSVDDKLMNILGNNDCACALKELQDCVAKKCCPSEKVLLILAAEFAKAGNRDGIALIQSVCREVYLFHFHYHGEFKQYLAECLWKSGKLKEALQCFEEAYATYPHLTRKIQNMTKFMVLDVISNRGEAALVQVTNFARNMAKTFGDFQFMGFVWHACFLSEWFSDQELAKELLTENVQLRRIIGRKVFPVCKQSLAERNLDVLHRLMETLLQFQFKEYYHTVLEALLLCHCDNEDLQACKQVLDFASKHNIALSAAQNQVFLRVLHKKRLRLDLIFGRLCYQKQNKELVTQSVKNFRLQF